MTSDVAIKIAREALSAMREIDKLQREQYEELGFVMIEEIHDDLTSSASVPDGQAIATLIREKRQMELMARAERLSMAAVMGLFASGVLDE